MWFWAVAAMIGSEVKSSVLDPVPGFVNAAHSRARYGSATSFSSGIRRTTAPDDLVRT